MSQKVTAAIVQSKSVYLNLQESVDKAVHYIEKASRKGAKLIAFGETWLIGYPTWLDYCPGAALWNHPPTKEVFALLRQNSPTVPGKEIGRIAQAAKEHGVVIVMGLNERVEQGPGNGTLYNSLITIGPDGSLLNHHRKLVPTYTERVIWGPGEADGLKAVETPVGRVGGLICWEHWMPLARQVLHNTAEQIHVAVWPTVNEMHQIAGPETAVVGYSFLTLCR
ncbi:nitrilase-related carbon-nitrogen hydrolase [Brevibacillus massiliensis]|uniref:nitrilase-related carbon-nitrogen hydrolase n=1 Tax=Brevibacillus massiliensis TaxID=1118054 RepID=UPI000312CF3F|nr:nitrilase-related carbon-nitrogen hydrolase [Brevibacillus massiliensis]